MTSNKEIVQRKILVLCKNQYRKASEISKLLGMTFNNVRAHYIYPMVKKGLLKRKFPLGARRNQEYITAK